MKHLEDKFPIIFQIEGKNHNVESKLTSKILNS